MSVRDFLSNISVILAVMALASILETVVPLFAGRAWTRGRRTSNLGLTAIVFLVNWMLTSVVALAAFAFATRPAAFMTWVGLPPLVQIVLGVLIIDFSTSYL